MIELLEDIAAAHLSPRLFDSKGGPAHYGPMEPKLCLLGCSP